MTSGFRNAGVSFVVVLLFLVTQIVSAADELTAEVMLSKDIYKPGDSVVAALVVTIPAKYHLYGNPLGPGIGKPLSLSVASDKGIVWGDILKQPAKKFIPAIGDWVWAYENRAVFFVRGVADSQASGAITDTIFFDALICHTACIPVQKSVPFTIKIDKNSTTAAVAFDNNRQIARILDNTSETMAVSSPVRSLSFNPGTDLSGLTSLSVGGEQVSAAVPLKEFSYSPQEKKVQFNLFLAIAFGFVAGIILNFMPCVLPVLGIKILSFAETSDGARKSALFRSGVFAAGILSVFMVLASLASFASFSWGEQFQNPIMLIGIIVLIVVFALWMFDIFTFTIPAGLLNANKKDAAGLWGDYFRGVFATVLATPCSGPFLGATLAWALTQSHFVVFTVFIAIGAGMAFPYVLLSSSKSFARMIPRPGKWMIDFKNIMGFVLIGFAVYLLVGLPQDMIVSAIGMCVSVIFAVALYTRLAPWGISTPGRRILSAVVSVAIAGCGIDFSYTTLYKQMSSQVANDSQNEKMWVDFDAAALQQAHADSRNVIIDFTANWCMNCQYNKITVYNSKEMKQLVDKKNILALKADLTRSDPQIEALMHSLGSRSVPFFAIFPADDPYHPVVMRDIVQKRAVIKALQLLPDKK